MGNVKGISRAAKLVLGTVVAVVVAAYIVVVDLGVSAGRIHQGVSVGTIGVGGMTQPEAADHLEDVGRRMRNEPVTFTVGGLEFEILPADVKWWPYAANMAEKAMSVGRKGGTAHAASDRWSSWFGGVELKWRRPRPRLVTREIEELSEELAARGYDLNEKAMRRMLRHAIWDWPRRDSYELPLVAN